MLRRAFVAVGLSAASLAGLALAAAPAAHAQGQACYSVQATVNGNQVVNQAGCQALP